MQKIGKIVLFYFRIMVLIVSVFFIWLLLVTYLFDVSKYDDARFIYVIAGTIITIFLYGKRKEI